MSETLKSHEIRRLLEEAIDAAKGNTVKLDKLAAMKIRDYIRATQEPVDQLRYFEKWMVSHLNALIWQNRASADLSPETRAFLEATDDLVAEALKPEREGC
jgi:hypothetical protein